jgi:hypothetical protein
MRRSGVRSSSSPPSGQSSKIPSSTEKSQKPWRINALGLDAIRAIFARLRARRSPPGARQQAARRLVCRRWTPPRRSHPSGTRSTPELGRHGTRKGSSGASSCRLADRRDRATAIPLRAKFSQSGVRPCRTSVGKTADDASLGRLPGQPSHRCRSRSAAGRVATVTNPKSLRRLLATCPARMSQGCLARSKVEHH